MLSSAAHQALARAATDAGNAFLGTAQRWRRRGANAPDRAWTGTLRGWAASFPTRGYLWWLRHRGTTWLQPPGRIARLEHEGLAVAKRLRGLSGRRFDRVADYWLAAGGTLRAQERTALSRWLALGKDAPVVEVPTDLVGFNANGWMGQYLAVYPRWKLVVVRQRRPITFTEEENQQYGFWNFFSLVERMVKEVSRGHDQFAGRFHLATF